MVTNIKGQDINITSSMLETVERLVDTKKGRFATVMGYVSTTGRTEPETADINFTSRFSYENLLEKKLIELKKMSAKDVGTEDVEQFEICKEKMVESCLKTLSGVREDAHRKAHDKFYVSLAEGVKLHLVTTKTTDGTVLVRDEDGNVIADRIMVSMLETGRKVIKAGVYKKVKHGKKVLMDKEINRVLKERGVKTPKTLSLKENNFDSLRIDTEVVEPEMV